ERSGLPDAQTPAELPDLDSKNGDLVPGEDLPLVANTCFADLKRPEGDGLTRFHCAAQRRDDHVPDTRVDGGARVRIVLDGMSDGERAAVSGRDVVIAQVLGTQQGGHVVPVNENERLVLEPDQGFGVDQIGRFRSLAEVALPPGPPTAQQPYKSDA